MFVKSLNVFYQNVRGLRTKTIELKNNILCSEYDIIIITETWLHEGIFDGEFCDDRYDVFRFDRDPTITGKDKGGGVFILTRRTLGATRKAFSSPAATELLWVTVPACACSALVNFHICAAYIPPEVHRLPSDIKIFADSVKFNMETYPNDNFFLIGDFNLPFITWNDSKPIFLRKGSIEVQDAGIELIETLQFLGLTQYNYLKNFAGNTLDLVFSNLPLIVSRSSVPLVKEDKAHPPFSIDILDLKLRPLKEASDPRRNFRKADYESINNFLVDIDWSAVLQNKSLDEAVAEFYSILNNCIDIYIPLKKYSTRSYPVWYTSALIKIIKEKSKAHRRWKKYGNKLDYDEFALLRDREHRVQKQCFETYTASCENTLKTNPKIFWSYTKAIRGGSGYPKSLRLQGIEHSTGESICNAFNDFFKGVFGEPSTVAGPTVESMECNNIISKVQVTTETVLNLLQHLDVNKGSGSDGIPPFFWRHCAQSLALPIAIIFNRSLNEGTFPALWKSAHVVPVHKKGSRAEIENYRAISILNPLAKMLEKIVYDAIYQTISQALPDSQHGFLKKRSTTTNLSCFTNFVLKSMDGGGQVDVVYTDMEKAFDRVDHLILLDKLNRLGIHGSLLRWVQSYLANRSQAVVLGGYRSNFVSIPTGVPQGSHLGPLFYNAYLYDIGSCFQSTKYLMYADDTKIFCKVTSEIDCQQMQNDLNCLLTYYNNNRLSINIKKCQCITLSRKPNPIIYNYTFDSIAIERTKLVRDLGVHFDDKMQLSEHIEHCKNKAYKNLGFILRICKPFSKLSSIKIIYYSFVRSTLEYACPVWSPNYITYIDKLERIQKIFIKNLNYRARRPSEPYENSCLAHNLLTLAQRRTVADMCLLYDIVNSRVDCPDLVAEIRYRIPSTRTRRRTALFAVPVYHTNYAKNMITARLMHTYNKQFNEIDLFSNSKATFKRKIITFFLS